MTGTGLTVGGPSTPAPVFPMLPPWESSQWASLWGLVAGYRNVIGDSPNHRISGIVFREFREGKGF